MASPTSKKTSWLKEKLTRRISGNQSKSSFDQQSFEEDSLGKFEIVQLGEDPLSIVDPFTEQDYRGSWEILTLEKQKKSVIMNSNQSDGVSGQGANKTNKKTSGGGSKVLMSPILGGRVSTGGIRSALKQDKKPSPEMERPVSAGAALHKSTGNKKKYLSTDQHTNSRTPSPNFEKGSPHRSSFKRKVGANRENSPIEDDQVNQAGNFSKVRDTLRIRKGKKKSTKVAQYSVPELNLPNKYHDPFEASTDFGETNDTSNGLGHEFSVVNIPHNKPEYCDHCQQAAWGHHGVLKCIKCDFVVHKKCEGRLFVKCSCITEVESVLQRDRANESLEETIECDKDIKLLSDSNTSLGSTNSILSNGYQVNSEKIILAKKIREYNRKTTPVHHIHIKSRDTLIDYQGFVRVHMSIQRPIHVSTGVTRTSWYRLMRPVKDWSINTGGLETAFYLPTDTNRLVHINDTTTTKELVITLLKKFCITDNPKKFSLYEEYGGDCRRLFEEDHPLTVILEGSVAGRNSKLVLRDNLCSTIQWDAFSLPELNNFITMLHREEKIYASRLSDCFDSWKKSVQVELEIKQSTPTQTTPVINGSHHPLTITHHAPPVKV